MAVTTPSWFAVLPAAMSAIAAISSATTAIVVARMQHKKGNVDAFFKLMERFESTELRQYRYQIYSLDRNRQEDWTDKQREAVTAWSAHLDLVASLILSRQVDRRQVFEMYGDVIIRSIYQLAPYCRAEFPSRGTQYLLAVRRLSNWIPNYWRKEILRGSYPSVIGLPGQVTVRLTPDSFAIDSDLRMVKWHKPKRKSRLNSLRRH